jgi:hypothetical protein
LGFGILPGVCGKSARTGFRLFPGSGDLPQSPANLGARQSAAFQQSNAAVKSRCLTRGRKNKPDFCGSHLTGRISIWGQRLQTSTTEISPASSSICATSRN